MSRKHLNSCPKNGVHFCSTRVFDQLFLRPAGKAVSAVRILQLANEQNVPIYRITKDNEDTVVPQLSVSAEVLADIRNATQAGLTVIVPQREMTHGSWTGSGYIVQDPVTGAAGYLLEGGLAGGAEGECVTQLTPQAVDVLSGFVAGVIQQMLAGSAAAIGAELAQLLAHFVIAEGASLGAAALVLEFAGPIIAAALLIAVMYMVATMIKLALVEMEMVGDSNATDCGCEPEPKPPECSCEVKYPDHILCEDLPSQYQFSNKSQAFSDFKARLGIFDLTTNPKGPVGAAATDGPCSIESGYVIGQHWTVVHRGTRIGSIGQCDCCEDTKSDAVLNKRARIIE